VDKNKFRKYRYFQVVKVKRNTLIDSEFNVSLFAEQCKTFEKEIEIHLTLLNFL